MNSKTIFFLDGIFHTLSILCSDTDYVPIFGVRSLPPGASTNDSTLIEGLNKVCEGTQIMNKRGANFEEEFDALYKKWIVNDLNNPNQPRDNLPLEKLQDIYDSVSEFIHSETKPRQALYTKLEGEFWEIQAEGVVIESDSECYIIYFMWSD